MRLADNPALTAAVQTGAPIIPIYILDNVAAGKWKRGAASRWYLHHALSALNAALAGRLAVFQGDAQNVLSEVTIQTGARAVYWNRRYTPWGVAQDKAIKSAFGDRTHSFHANAVYEPFQKLKADGTPYRVFTPYYRAWRRDLDARDPLTEPRVNWDAARLGKGIDALALLPKRDWARGFLPANDIGEAGAQARLSGFLNDGLVGYIGGRDFLDQTHFSMLSADLHFGNISPFQILAAVRDWQARTGHDADAEGFIRQICWRDFAQMLLFYFPELPKSNYQVKFDAMPWRDDDDALYAWQSGATGIPIVDAAMRELWQTGVMHNRARMIVGSFLTKNLLVDWRRGQDWFWDTLIDADLGNNAMGWQWVAGTGIDAAPYFRVFNPVTQGQKFDPLGDFTRRFVAELAGLPNKYLHAPWMADAEVLSTAGVRLGANYPHPIVDLRAARQRALDAFKSIG